MEFYVLGAVEVRRNGQLVDLKGNKPRTLLAALLFSQGRIISDAQLSLLLWGENPPATFNAQIHTYVSRLRKILCPDAEIVREQPGYFIDIKDSWFDYQEFDRLTREGRRSLLEGHDKAAAEMLHRGLSTWRGTALANVSEFLIDAERPWLEEARLAAQESRIEADLALGRHAQLVSELTGLVAKHPLREHFRAQLMTALNRSGRQADALETYQEARRILVEELGVEPGQSLRDAHHAILTGVRPVPVPTPPERPETRPDTLPIDIADFSGREAELATLSEITDEKHPGVELITGMPGVGKSALAVHAAHLKDRDFPDGRLYINLRDARGQPIGPADALSQLLEGLGVPAADIPEGMEERRRLYRLQLGRLRVLVMLDNAADEHQVRPLVPSSANSRAIVTSQSRLPTLEGIKRIELDRPSVRESVELLGRYIGKERIGTQIADAERIVEYCGNLPLALRIAGAHLIRKPHWSLARLAEWLADPRHRLTALRLGDLDARAAILSGYQRLTGPERVAFRRLGLLRVPDFPAWVADSLLTCQETQGAQGTDLVEALVDARLLLTSTSTPGTGELRYRFHELVALAARELACTEDTPDEREAALDRVFTHCLVLVQEAGRPAFRDDLEPSSQVLVSPRNWLASERTTLAALAQQASESGRDAIACSLVETLRNVSIPFGAGAERWTVPLREARSGCRLRD
ncbi:AfsR/SARP family transcriptional regulator [Streptomyces sp. UNOC14_S4]|uniref:AfsR/SARP family transcriptional regulator n=1 Tax=Streptomyces sp. UNOC14_S4 TaxID=2872340 RepID=UPI001E32F4B5|nr:AfsR/SARP family transcriptional regulator [Streptomyces sp. UNOC14_S4]MCC3771373.1 winged helix-turn-helix domain-containing protein [Streptomyces sp. UNOC14_S4]